MKTGDRTKTVELRIICKGGIQCHAVCNLGLYVWI